jgi:type VI secretion system protein ImpF
VAINPDLPLLPSVLDRLMDDRPEQSQDPARSRGQNLAILRDAVRRDLEALLNSRQRCVSPPTGLDELQISLIEYGVPDFLSANAGSDEAREEFRRSIEQVIRRFEPRFKTVTVKLIEDNVQLDRTLRFRIDALMYAEPAPEYVSFDSLLNPASHSFSVLGRRDG